MIPIDAKRCNHCQEVLEEHDTLVCEICVQIAMSPWAPEEKAAAKSSATALAAGVCQGCGHKLDGRPLEKPCNCPCH
jgi:hypothetical protein